MKHLPSALKLFLALDPQDPEERDEPLFETVC